MDLPSLAYAIGAIALLVLFWRGMNLTRARQPYGSWMMWGAVVGLIASGFVSGLGIGFVAILVGFALAGQAGAEMIRARRSNARW